MLAMSKQESDQKREKSRPRALLREWRIHQGLTLQEVGDRMGIHRSQVSNWETGFRSMPEKKMLAYCEAIGVDIARIYQMPDAQSIDELLENATPEQKSKAYLLVKVFLNKE